MRKPRSLTARLALLHGLVVAAVLCAYTALVWFAAIAEDNEDESIPETEAAELSAQARVLWSLAFGLPAAIVVSSAGAWWIARRQLVPLEEIMRVAESMGPGALDRRIAEPRDAALEVQRLIAVLNAMLERLDHALTGMQRFTADASHELRTPLTSVIGNLEVALRRPRDPAELASAMELALEELVDASRLLESLLTLARSDAGQLELTTVRMELSPIVLSAIEPYAPIAAERGIELVSPSPAPSIFAEVDAMWLRRAIANLVDNACKFTPLGGRVEVTVFAEREHAVIEVRDNGPGLQASEVERAFERFFRGSGARANAAGFGLGLAIARDVLRAMGGGVSLDSSSGEGTRARIHVPLVS